VLLVAVTVRRAGTGTLRGLGRTFVAGSVATVTAAAAGGIVGGRDWGPDSGVALGQGMLSATVVLAVFAAVVALGAREELRAVTSRLRRGRDNGRTAGA
jgi:outer membrane lipoprotein SlyB